MEFNDRKKICKNCGIPVKSNTLVVGDRYFCSQKCWNYYRNDLQAIVDLESGQSDDYSNYEQITNGTAGDLIPNR